MEIGIRIALGAQPWLILRLIIGGGLAVGGIGMLAGLVSAGAIGILARGLLFGMSPTDPVAYFCASGLLALVVLVACYFPARRAMRVDPLTALRHD